MFQPPTDAELADILRRHGPPFRMQGCREGCPTHRWTRVPCDAYVVALALAEARLHIKGLVKANGEMGLLWLQQQEEIQRLQRSRSWMRRTAAHWIVQGLKWRDALYRPRGAGG